MGLPLKSQKALRDVTTSIGKFLCVEHATGWLREKNRMFFTCYCMFDVSVTRGNFTNKKEKCLHGSKYYLP